MTVMQERRYATSSTRNVELFIKRGGKAPGQPAQQIDYAKFCGMELDDLKHHVGVRKKDTHHDLTLGAWLGPVKAHAAKNKIAAKSHTKAGPVVEAKKDSDFVRKVQSAGRDIEFPHAKGHNVGIYYADDKTTHYEAPAKKVNPKKAARQAAIEASGTAPGKRINADEQRAQAMAAKAKRQPRIMTKN